MKMTKLFPLKVYLFTLQRNVNRADPNLICVSTVYSHFQIFMVNINIFLCYLNNLYPKQQSRDNSNAYDVPSL